MGTVHDQAAQKTPDKQRVQFTRENLSGPSARSVCGTVRWTRRPVIPWDDTLDESRGQPPERKTSRPRAGSARSRTTRRGPKAITTSPAGGRSQPTAASGRGDARKGQTAHTPTPSGRTGRGREQPRRPRRRPRLPSPRPGTSHVSRASTLQGVGSGANFANGTMWTRDNLNVLRGLNSESVDLVYADPAARSNEAIRQRLSSVGVRCPLL